MVILIFRLYKFSYEEELCMKIEENIQTLKLYLMDFSLNELLFIA